MTLAAYGYAWALLIAVVMAPVVQAAPASSSDANELTIPASQSYVIRYPAVKRIAAGDGSIIDVKVLDDTEEVLVLARKEGVTDLRIWGRDGSTATRVVRVVGASNPSLLADALPQPTILIKARLIEVRKSALRDIGIDWADVAAGPIFGTLDEYVTNEFYRLAPGSVPGANSLPLNVGKSNHYFALTTSIDSLINLLVNNGNARTLAEPTLTCINGGRADFLVGGEVPIPVQNQDGALNVVFKQFGIILNIEPRATAGLIRTRVNVEVSSVDKGFQVLGIPGFATRKTNTEMNVQAGETMVVAGLLTAEDAKTVVKVPGLGNLPILGELFKSRQFRRGQSELVVLVTPYIVQSDSAAIKAGVRRFDELRKESEKAALPALMD